MKIKINNHSRDSILNMLKKVSNKDLFDPSELAWEICRGLEMSLADNINKVVAPYMDATDSIKFVWKIRVFDHSIYERIGEIIGMELSIPEDNFVSGKEIDTNLDTATILIRYVKDILEGFNWYSIEAYAEDSANKDNRTAEDIERIVKLERMANGVIKNGNMLSAIERL